MEAEQKLGLANDGERMIPEYHAGTLMYAEHMSRYRFAAQFVAGKAVLDVASGSGYGTELLKLAGAASVAGLDNTVAALAYALATHSNGRPDFLAGDAQHLPFLDATFDVIVSFETLEHVSDPGQMLTELRRILKPNGILIISTPNKGVYLEGNPFHINEMTYDDFSQRLSSLFANVEILAQDNWIASALFDETTMLGEDTGLDAVTGLFKATSRQPGDAVYLIAVCSDAELPKAAGHISLTTPAEIEQYMREVIEARSTIEVQTARADFHERRQQDMAATLHRLEGELERSRRTIEGLFTELEGLRAHVRAITGSIGYRLLEGYRRGMRAVAPAGSIQGKSYRMLVSGVRKTGRGAMQSRRLVRSSRRVIKNEGWGSFSKKARTRIINQLTGKPVASTFRPITYEKWILANEPKKADLVWQRQAAKSLFYRPKVSVVTPVWNPDPRLLRETIESVRGQTYDNWELCLADGGSTAAGVRETLAELAASDPRIQVQYLDENLGISGNTNEGIQRSDGEYIAFLDHTDVLAPNALWEVVSQLNRNPSLTCLYSDHDLISVTGQRHEPLFKPAWSPETILSANFATHFCVMKASLVKDLGGLRAETDGAQDWDLLLRVSRETDGFTRIPKVLYHWRVDSESTVSSASNKGYALAAQERALSDHLAAIGSTAQVGRHESGGPHLEWQLDGTTKVSLIIATKHNRKMLAPCLGAIAKSSYRNFEAIVVDNGGHTPENENWYGVFKDIGLRVLWWDGPFNYSAVNNLGAREATGDVLLFLNDDTQATSREWLDEMLGWIGHPGIGAVGAQLLWKNGRIQHGGDVLGMNGFADHLFTGANPYEWTLMGSPLWYRNVSAVTGACLMMKRDLFLEVGGFNEAFHLCGSDVELCLRVRRAGYRIVCTPFAGVLHHERATRGGYDDAADVYTSFWYYQSKLYGGDPYFNPNLSLLSTTPQLRHSEEPKPPEMVAPVLGRSLVINKQGAARMEEEAVIFAEAYQLMPGEVDATRRLHEANKAPIEVKTINWFIPDFESPFYGGIHTILRFADRFMQTYGVSNRFIVLGSGPEDYIRSGIRAAFPSLGDSEIIVSGQAEEDIRKLPYADVSIATLWITAYAVSKFGNTRRKFYMIQDFEAIFYPAGTLHALSEATYRMGLYGICNTHTLQRIYESDYGGRGFGFDPAVDTALFHPAEGPRHKKDTMTVFLYGRPGTWRNCWELAMSALRRLKQRTKKRIRVVTAGSWAPPPDSESAYLIDNLGLLDYRDTAELYRTVDVGLTLSVSKHPSYLPLELMASGVLVVSNINTAGSWLLKDGENCLLSEPTAESLAHALDTALNDDEMRERLSKNAVDYIRENFADWPSRIDAAYGYLCNPEGL